MVDRTRTRTRTGSGGPGAPGWPAGLRAAHLLFESQCRTSPDAPALAYQGDALSYAELDARANRLARRLVADGVRGGTVGICLGRSLLLPVAVLATLRAGAAYLPLDPADPSQRLGFMLRDGGARTLLTERRLADGLPVPRGVAVRRLDQTPARGDPANEPVDGPVSEPVGPDDLAYVIYTSGSTGRPKGVAMPHGPLANLIRWQRARSACGRGTRTLQFSALGFDVSFQEMFATWAAGGCLVVVPEEIRRDPGRLLAFVDESGINRVFMPFVALQAMAQAARRLERRPPSLTEVITAGEQLQVTPALREFFGGLPGASLENQYGPSETHVVTALRLGPDPAGWPDLPSVGRPIDNARVHVLDERMEPLPAGAVGELCVGGPVLARGYVNRPELTARRFVPDPLGEPGERVYRTGDLGSRTEDGQIRFLGRTDDQVKIRGHRVELGEVEAAVRAVPGIKDAAVVTRESADAGRRIIAYTLHDPSGAPTPAGLRRLLSRTLPPYMVPALVVEVDAFPLTPSGKVDRRALAAREIGAPAAEAAAPRDEVEERVSLIWSRCLAVPRVDLETDFHELGGDSLSGTVLVSRINEAFGVEADLDVLVRNPTVARMAAWIRAGRPRPAANPAGAGPRTQRRM